MPLTLVRGFILVSMLHDVHNILLLCFFREQGRLYRCWVLFLYMEGRCNLCNTHLHVEEIDFLEAQLGTIKMSNRVVFTQGLSIKGVVTILFPVAECFRRIWPHLTVLGAEQLKFGIPFNLRTLPIWSFIGIHVQIRPLPAV